MENVGLIDVDSLIANLALMKVSAHHKALGDRVKRYPRADEIVTEGADVVYVSTIFDFSRRPRIISDGAAIVQGGPGYDISVPLPCDDTIYPDYGLFACDQAMGRITRGCVRRCPWCIVWRQDGRVRQVADLEDFWDGQERLRLLDDNLTAMPDLFIETCEKLTERKIRTYFEALDIRLMTPEMATALKRVKRDGRVHFAWDSMKEEEGVRRGIANLKKGGFGLSQASFYILIGFDTTPEEDLYRLWTLDGLGVESFVMPFNKFDLYQRRFARWANAKQLMNSIPFDKYVELLPEGLVTLPNERHHRSITK